MWRCRLSILFVLWSQVGCATLYESVVDPNICRLESEGKRLVISGSTNQKMLACVKKHLTKNVEVLEVKSFGGRVDTAIQIAEVLAPHKLHIEINTSCSSSCANYFLPVARRITLLPNSQIILHGSIDSGFVARMKNAGLSGFETLVNRQKGFVKSHNVHPGWLLYRSPDDYKNKTNGQYITGEHHYWANTQPSGKLFLVEEAFIRSCLPHIEIDVFFDTDVQKIYTDIGMQRRFSKRGMYPTGTMRCYTQNPVN